MNFSETRYDNIQYRRCGRSGLLLPVISLGCWQNFTDVDTTRKLLRRAFDLGITHFDLANNYGPPPGIAEENVGKVLKEDFASNRDELIISTKAGYDMWPGPYGNFGSKKYLVASLDQSLKRLQLEYVDIFYHHRPDPDTPLEETMGALDLVTRQGKTLYAGVSNYDPAMTCEASRIMDGLGTPITIHQPRYNMMDRTRVEGELLRHVERLGIGMIVFSPLNQGILTNRYLKNDVPAESRAGKGINNLQNRITPAMLETVRQLNQVAEARGQTLAQMALAWTLRDERITSVVIGASREQQLDDNVAALDAPTLSAEELARIDMILAG
ncbi:MAG: aldo/keto reductase [Chloroflexota bacterium]